MEQLFAKNIPEQYTGEISGEIPESIPGKITEGYFIDIFGKISGRIPRKISKRITVEISGEILGNFSILKETVITKYKIRNYSEDFKKIHRGLFWRDSGIISQINSRKDL